MIEIVGKSNGIKKSGYIYPFNLIRISCAFLVFLFHLNLQFGLSINNIFVDKVISAGNFTMTIFFMLSGFVLYNQYGEVSLLENGKSLWAFYKKRILGIFPPYWTVLLLYYFGTSYNMPGGGRTFALVPAEFLGIQCFFQDIHRFSGNDLLWFVSVLVFLYFLYPFIQFIINHLKKYRYVCMIVAYLLSVYTIIIYVFFRDAKIFYYNNAIYRIPEFILGIVLAQIIRMKKNTTFIGGKCTLVSSVVLIVLVYVFKDIKFINIPFGYMALTFNVITIPFIAVILIGVTNIKNSWFINFCANKVISYLAKISLCFYLTQGIMIRIVRVLITRWGIKDLDMFVISLVLNLGLAVILYEIVEKNVKKIAKKYCWI